MPAKIDHCRICGSRTLEPVLDLGEQALTGVFIDSSYKGGSASLVLVAMVSGIAGTTWGLIEAKWRAEGERVAKLDAEVQKKKALVLDLAFQGKF